MIIMNVFIYSAENVDISQLPGVFVDDQNSVMSQKRSYINQL